MSANRLAFTLAAGITAALTSGPQSLPAEDSVQPSSAAETLMPALASASPPAHALVEAEKARGILGRAVQDPEGAAMGHIVDVIVDPGGHVLGAVIDFGGFLGVGSRKIAVDWSALHFGRAVKQGDQVTITLSPDELKKAPEYREGKPVAIVGSARSLKRLDFAAPTASEK